MGGFQVTTKDDIEPKAEYFDRKVTIEQPTNTPNVPADGGVTPGWTNIFPGTVWVHMEPWKGREIFFAQQVYPNAYSRVVLRYRKTVNITPTQRMRYKSKIYNIRWVGVPAEARKVIELLVEELQAKGSVA
jgi:SPP1 family predicted phage head-tail adaptor